ncbi:hypothetical protein PhaeoP24_03903 (plasmid) [Phaeobacter inhibens]|jgi:hypothetical protein|uniref:DUF6915 domain-containing protein n=1 Tax=Tritonibacter horizontis TaxID=1768241 RepID=A0A132BRK5_9RHOB|nr:hypothetical protein PhaeoP24_03903 [Phaeobacter inhibens]KUP91001.1 hypothetical protein TRIHO_41180 [Tritonibacter horizontis]
MAHPLHHAESSARKFGGVPDDYQFVHDWFDSSKEHLGLFVHRDGMVAALPRRHRNVPKMWSYTATIERGRQYD